MKGFLLSATKQTIKTLSYGLLGGFSVLIVLFVLYLESRPDLKVWHEARLDAEFTAESPVQSFADYLALEERLFDQLEERVFSRVLPWIRALSIAIIGEVSLTQTVGLQTGTAVLF